MSRNPLEALLRFRKTTVDDAQKAMAEAHRVEQDAIQAVRQATEALEHEMRAASNLSAGDDAVESFARWLPTGRKRINEAHARRQTAAASLDQARTVLLLARSAVRSVESVIQEKKDEAGEHARKKEQAELDEFSLRR